MFSKTSNRKTFKHLVCPDLEQLEDETTENGRYYFSKDGRFKYPSVTTVLSSISKDGIEKWRQAVGEEEAQRILKQAGVRGTAFHQIAEDYVMNREEWNRDVMPVNMFSFNQIKSVLDNHVDNIMYVEAPLYSDRLRVAGRTDLIAEYDGEAAIIDFKTSRKVKREEWIKPYFMQEATYAEMLKERTGINIKKLVTIMAIDHEQPKVFIQNKDDHLQDFISLRKNYYLKHKI